MPHLLIDEQKRQRVKVAKKLLQMFPKYDKKQFANCVMKLASIIFEPVRKVNNKTWSTKHSQHPILAKRSLGAKNSEPEFYGDLVYKFRKIIGKNDFLYHFKKIIVRYKKIG